MNVIVINARISTMKPDGTTADALDIQDGKIVAVGTNDEITTYRQPDTMVIDAEGKIVLPGFIEPHNHLISFGTSLLAVDVRTPPNRTITDVVDRLRQRASETSEGEWVVGRGYDDTGVTDMRHPTRDDLDRASTKHPIVIWHISGHLLAANSLALSIGEVTSDTQDPPGGRIGRRPGNSEPDGVLYEGPAQVMVSQHIPAHTKHDVREGFVKAQAEFLRQGVTTIHDASVGRSRGVDMLDTYESARNDGVLNLRVNMFLQWQLLEETGFGFEPGSGDEWIRVAGCKIVSDGSIQGLTGALREPYVYDENESGWLIYEQEELNAMVLALHSRGYQIATHANGDAAIDSILDAYENALTIQPRSDHRYRIEHCQVCHPEHIERMQKLGIIPDFFANHIYYWGDRHRERFLGPDRVMNLDPVGSAVRAGLMPILHSDCPVTPVSPLFCIQNAVHRVTSGGEILNASERISVEDGIATMTRNAARAAFQENIMGTLEIGKLGDFVILDQDPFSIEPHQIGQIEVAATVVDGQLMYGKDSLSVG
jgi:predicted amidohydrolase YtcJ